MDMDQKLILLSCLAPYVEEKLEKFGKKVDLETLQLPDKRAMSVKRRDRESSEGRGWVPGRVDGVLSLWVKGYAAGMQTMLIDLLDLRFGSEAKDLNERIWDIDDTDMLRCLAGLAFLADKLEDFVLALDKLQQAKPGT